MRRVLTILIIIIMSLTACSGGTAVDRLAYQDRRLYIEAVFTIDEESFPIKLTLEAPEYDDTGRMLARDARLIIDENSIISGVGFEVSGGAVYISSGELKIPINDEEMISGIEDIISLFCISDECYYSSEKVMIEKLECEHAVYIDGNNRVEILIDLTCALPKNITAVIDNRRIAADISMIKAE